MAVGDASFIGGDRDDDERRRCGEYNEGAVSGGRRFEDRDRLTPMPMEGGYIR